MSTDIKLNPVNFQIDTNKIRKITKSKVSPKTVLKFRVNSNQKTNSETLVKIKH